MKADLYIGDDVSSIELVTRPFPGELVIFGGKSFPVSEVSHDADKRKLRVTCDRPAETEAVPVESEENDMEIE